MNSEKIIIEFLADGFEEIEALCPVDVLRRAGLKIKTASVGKGENKEVCGSHGISVTADITAEEAVSIARDAGVAMVILPGGMPGAKNLDESAQVHCVIDIAVKSGAYVASICAAPMIPGKLGLLSGRRAVCYPGFEKYLTGAECTGGRVEADGKFITACGMGAATEFALECVKALKGENAASEIAAAIIAK